VTLAKDTKGRAIRISHLDEEICKFDGVLDRIQKLMTNDLKVYDRIVEVRDAIFRLHNQMHGCEVVEFAAPWVEPADLFWHKKKEDTYQNESDSCLEGEEDDE
jgi:hypothetical protein